MNQLKRKCKKRGFLSIHDRFIRDARFRKTMIELGRTEEVIREMDKLANEDHTHIATVEELNVFRGNWWIRSNFVGSDTMPIRHRPDFKEALSTLRRLKNAEDQAYYQNGWQSSSSSWWQWQDSWWHPSSETSPRRWLDTDGAGRSGILPRTVHKELGIILRKKMLLEFAESGHPTFRATTPLSRGQLKSKGHGKLSIHFAADKFTIETIFVNQLSIYGTVAAICEEFENHQDGSGEPKILMGQSIILGEIKAEVPLQNENSMNHQILWQQYIERIESLSPESKVSRFCKEAGFTRVVEVGQYLVTKDTGNLRQFRSVACREYTLPRDDPASEAKGWIQGNMTIGPVLEVTTSFQHFKYGIEIRIWSVNQDNSQSWFRISYGTIKYVIDSNQNNTEILADPQEDQVPQTSIKVVAARSKAKANPQPRALVGTTATIPMHERRWIDIEPSEQTLAAYDLSKKVISLLRHNQTVQREKDGAIELYRIKFYLRNHHSQIQLWSDDRWKACLAAGGGSKRRDQYCSDNSGRILYLRALQGHSGNNLIDPTLQDNVVIGSGIFHYIYHIGCAFNLHSIINNGLIPGGQDLSRRQTVFFLPIDPRDENHKDPEHIDFSVPRRARYVHSAWKRHQDAVFWVDIDLAIREGLTFYQTRSNAIILQGTFPAYCIPKVERLKTGEVLYEKSYSSPRAPPKISLRHDWARGEVPLGSTVDQQSEGEVVQQSQEEVARRAKIFQPIPKPICDRSGQRDITQDVISVQTCPSEENKNVRVEQTHDRSGQPDKHNVVYQTP